MIKSSFVNASLGSKDEKWLLEEKYGGKETLEFSTDCKRLASGEPLAYVIGWQPFLGLNICLDSRPLIPRPETEWWVEKLLAQVGDEHSEVFRSATARGAAIFQQKNTRPPKAGAQLRFLDLCAGSGAIGCAALARLPDTRVYFGEVDPVHEATIVKNIRKNGLDESRASVRIGDLFEPFAGTTFDVIAANPPYVPALRALPAGVVDYEPARALRAGEDGLGVIHRIAEELPGYLAKNGEAWIECDSETAAAAAALFESRELRAEIRNDQYGKPRIIVVSFQ